MATFIKRGNLQWQAKIRRKGHPSLSKTFDNKKDAEEWALEIEREIRRGIFIDRRETESKTLDDALEKYLKEVTPGKKSAKREAVRINYLKGLRLAKYAVANIRPKDIAEFRDARRKEGMSENTIRLDLACLSAVYTSAKKDWGWAVGNPVREITQPKASSGRKRRLSAIEEEALLLAVKKAMPRTLHSKELIQLALETGMRQSELLHIVWDDIDLKNEKIHLDDTKSGDPRDVPLSPRALKIIKNLPVRIDKGKVFQVRQDALCRGFKKACEIAKAETDDAPTHFMEDLTFHDLRHEAASRWASVLEAHELAKMFGWKTIQMAMRYYHPKVEELARKLRNI